MSRIVRSVAARSGLLLAILICGTGWRASATADDAAKPAGKAAAVKKKNAARAASTAGQSEAATADKSTATDKPAAAGSAAAANGAAEPIESAWSARVHAALRRESSAKGAAQDEAVRDLVKLYESLKTAKGIDPDERAELGGLMRNRLARASERISKRLDKASKKPAAAAANELVTSAGAAGEKSAASGNAASGNAASSGAAASQSSAAGQGARRGRPTTGRSWSN